jgi:hypothetical protein
MSSGAAPASPGDKKADAASVVLTIGVQFDATVTVSSLRARPRSGTKSDMTARSRRHDRTYRHWFAERASNSTIDPSGLAERSHYRHHGETQQTRHQTTENKLVGSFCTLAKGRLAAINAKGCSRPDAIEPLIELVDRIYQFFKLVRPKADCRPCLKAASYRPREAPDSSSRARLQEPSTALGPDNQTRMARLDRFLSASLLCPNEIPYGFVCFP